MSEGACDVRHGLVDTPIDPAQPQTPDPGPILTHTLQLAKVRNRMSSNDHDRSPSMIRCTYASLKTRFVFRSAA